MGTKSWFVLAGAALATGAALGFVASLLKPRRYGSFAGIVEDVTTLATT
jgi:hypothetical protein